MGLTVQFPVILPSPPFKLVLIFLSGSLGETGIGKSTLMDTLFNTKFESDPATHNEPGVRLKARSYELQESNVRLKLTIVDTVGFGDQINKDDRYVLGVLRLQKWVRGWAAQGSSISRKLQPRYIRRPRRLRGQNYQIVSA